MHVRSLDRNAVVAALRALAARVGRSQPEVLEIRLFGSLARNERNPWADADWLVILERSDLAYRDRAPLYKPIGSPVPMDLVVCTREELARELEAGNRFVRRIVSESIVLYARSAREPSTSGEGPTTEVCGGGTPVRRADQEHVVTNMSERDVGFMKRAYALALASYEEGGCPIGSVLVDDSGNVLGEGHNMLVQEGNPIVHGEMAAMRAAGRMPSRRNTTMYTTLSPCLMCAGTIVQFQIRRVVVGDTVNSPGNVDFLRERGVEVTVLNDRDCIDLVARFRREKPDLWLEDWGGPPR